MRRQKKQPSVDAELMASIRRVMELDAPVIARTSGITLRDIRTENCGTGIYLNNCEDVLINKYTSINDNITLEINSSTRSVINDSTSYKGDSMSDKETKGFVIKNSTDTSFSNVKSIGNTVGYEVLDSADTHFESTSAISLEAHKVSGQLQYYIAQMSHDKILDDNKELKDQLMRLDNAIKDEGLGSKAVKFIASNAFTLVMSVVAGYGGNNLPDVLLSIRTFLAHLF